MKRSDLDAARGIFWWAVVPLVLLVVSGLAFAAPNDPIRVCRGAASSNEGQPIDPGCAQAGGTSMDITVSQLLSTDMIAGYDQLLNEYVMWLPATLIANPSRAFWPYNPQGEAYASFAALQWQGGGGGQPGEGGLYELDLEAFGTSWAAAFGLVFAFWGLGKGISVVLDVFRR